VPRGDPPFFVRIAYLTFTSNIKGESRAAGGVFKKESPILFKLKIDPAISLIASPGSTYKAGGYT